MFRTTCVRNRRDAALIASIAKSQANNAAYLSPLETAHIDIIRRLFGYETDRFQLTVLNGHGSIMRSADDLGHITRHAKHHSDVTINKRAHAFVRLQVPDLASANGQTGYSNGKREYDVL